ncbi:MAG: GNAT family N-acetyltransferase, partial [Caldilineaceae bacterium]
HTLGQPGTFLTSLGPDVLSVLYRALPETAGGFGYAVEDVATGMLLGFISATAGVSALFVEMGTRRLPAFAPALLAAYGRRPGLILRSAQTLIYPLLAAAEEDPAAQAGPTAELLSIMVEPEWRSRGLGALLVNQLAVACVARAMAHLDVTVDAANSGAQRFYRRHGFCAHHTISLYGRPMAVLRRHLPAP